MLDDAYALCEAGEVSIMSLLSLMDLYREEWKDGRVRELLASATSTTVDTASINLSQLLSIDTLLIRALSTMVVSTMACFYRPVQTGSQNESQDFLQASFIKVVFFLNTPELNVGKPNKTRITSAAECVMRFYSYKSKAVKPVVDNTMNDSNDNSTRSMASENANNRHVVQRLYILAKHQIQEPVTYPTIADQHVKNSAVSEILAVYLIRTACSQDISDQLTRTMIFDNANNRHDCSAPIDVYKKAHSALLLCLDNKVLREVNKEDSAAGVWLKLETLYMTKSLANKLYLKKKLFTFYMHSDAKDDGDLLYGSDMHSEGYDNGDLLMAVSEERFLEWIMDSGGSFHMTPRRDFLFDFKEFNGGTILLDDNRACVIMGTGKVRVQMKDGSSFVLENARYIPELKRNLISLGTLDQEGYTVKLQNGIVKVIKGSLMVLSGTMKGNCVYSLDGWTESGEASVGIQEKKSLAQV
ncbi:retrovirus-related pol polyprotein from transposon TNT 1-94, partial [Tanacetum coccineum]